MLQQESPIERSFVNWRRDIPELDNQHLKELKSCWRLTVISARDQLIQTKWLHRIYFTPVRLVQMRKLTPVLDAIGLKALSFI